MKKANVLIHFLILLLFGLLVSCSEDDFLQSNIMDAESEASILINSENSNSRSDCIHFYSTYSEVELGCVAVPEPTCEDLIYEYGFGAKPYQITIGDYDGYLMSIVTSQRVVGKGKQSVDHLTLRHVFLTEDLSGGFWTEDRAVCTPGAPDGSCRVNDQLTIAGGCGIFEGASGKFHNNGIITFTGTDCMPFVPSGIISGNMRGVICLPD